MCVNGSSSDLFSNIWYPARISTRSNPLHYLCEWNKQCLPHCWNYVQMILCCIALSTVQLTIRYFRLILMTYAHGPASTCLNLVRNNASTCSFLTRNNYTPPQTTCASMACRWIECMSTNIWLTSGLTLSKHINTICNKAKQKIGILYRKYYQHASTASMLQVYLACLRPDLEYAAPVWSPHQQGLKDQIEGVQKLALKICTKQLTTSYSTLLTLTRVPSLEKRRQILKLCYIY